MQGLSEVVSSEEYVATDSSDVDKDAEGLEEGLEIEEISLPYPFSKKHSVVVVPQSERKDDTDIILLAHVRTVPCEIIAELIRFLGSNIAFYPVEQLEMDRLLEIVHTSQDSLSKKAVDDLGDHYDLSSLIDAVPETEDLLERENDAPVIRLINAFLSEAIREEASDIHLETFEQDLLVRFRVDGVMREIVRPRRALAPLIISRIKIMAHLDIAEKRLPQDGRISLKAGGREVDVRVSTLPTAHGERIVMRLLDKQTGKLNLSKLGMDPALLKALKHVLSQPHGVFLVTGPTGSGKSTTLYAGISELDSSKVNILTVEDPIEYHLMGIGQTQVNVKSGMTFAKGLRAMLRQDPDVVMIGEIRDVETAQIAIQASLTGHLVLSTLHTNTAAGTVTRLIDMQIEPFLVASGVIAVLAQRLVRVLCPDCKVLEEPSETEQAFFEGRTKLDKVYHPVGCEECHHQGYRGRTGVYELLLFDDHIRKMVHEQFSETQLLEYVRGKGFDMKDDGYRKVKEGVTTVAEVLRVTLDT